ncbi:flagellar biosynthesis protein FlgD [Rhodobacter sphaeroides]|jgi:Flagellar hook capping protein|uniref:Basal-body rod modification protein FlgD n=2 Tax=Cereibacter sphaeroides TaxID=1063 RepID=Q3J1S8_CERS4|nr:flagellar hook capping FlgD N-terminal domain-containing protein [Cereibacter sphaeroides]ABA79256.1 Flagellar scaffolding protein FlgD [Cereibacter sphaeroides 2.4.1]ACM01257.1 Flagellar scaffolding protein FlgD [Cereibacter sphaeroides KD131]AMJ47556.1 flagellar biosynthesis protein FlgD [Cereibacter sphaeroides]ANS34268.1 flagellar biosynthesis protein FlgD [Cereibacter sphaeroides]ATN63313.1 flagellar biosynthesis protein FlgD [Cereibacter sphaeroides]
MTTAVDASYATGLALQTSTQAKGKSNLGQQDFLTLLTTQLQNQDPFQPMENGEFLAQMAQFSTVSGIEQLNSTLTGIGDGLGAFRTATAASLIGKSVLVPGTLVRADGTGTVRGAVTLTDPAEALVVTYSNSVTGELLHSQTLGAQSAGDVSFGWDGVPSSLVSSRVPLRVSVTAASSDGSVPLAPKVYARVLSVGTSADGKSTVLEVEDKGNVAADTVTSFR